MQWKSTVLVVQIAEKYWMTWVHCQNLTKW